MSINSISSPVDAERGGVQCEDQQPRAVLFIDPDSHMRRILHSHFEKHGYHVLGTDNCEEALLVARLYAGPIQLVIANPAKDDPWLGDLTQVLHTMRRGTTCGAFRELSGRLFMWEYPKVWMPLWPWAERTVSETGDVMLRGSVGSNPKRLARPNNTSRPTEILRRQSNCGI
jgi:hypothetical protein